MNQQANKKTAIVSHQNFQEANRLERVKKGSEQINNSQNALFVFLSFSHFSETHLKC